MQTRGAARGRERTGVSIHLRARAKELVISNFKLRVESEVAGFFVFSHIRILGYFRLG